MHACAGTTIVNNVVSGYLAEGVTRAATHRTGVRLTTGPGGSAPTHHHPGSHVGVGGRLGSPRRRASGDSMFPLSMGVLVAGPARASPMSSLTTPRGIVVSGTTAGTRISGKLHLRQ
jgi:hypothetical protein